MLGQGFEVRAGMRDIEKANLSIPSSDNLEFVSFFWSQLKQIQSSKVLSIVTSICIWIWQLQIGIDGNENPKFLMFVSDEHVMYGIDWSTAFLILGHS